MGVEIVAEFTTNHLGNPRLLRRMTEAAKAAGADSVKMQMKDVETFYTKEQLDHPYDSPYGKTRREYRQSFELSRLDWLDFHLYCGLPFFVTPQDMRSLHTIVEDALNVAPYFRSRTNRWRWENTNCLRRIKISSTNARKPEFVAKAAAMIPLHWDVVVSVAGQTLPEIESVVKAFSGHEKLWILHCVAEYPTPLANLRLGNIAELKKQFGSDRVKIGYSGHEKGLPLGGDVTSCAVLMGAEMIERHFCITRTSFAHHIECSLEPGEFKEMANCVHDKTGLPWQDPEEWKRQSVVGRTCFGMSPQERSFLEDQEYGK